MNSERTDALIESLWDKREDPRTADTLLRAIETQAKLEGAFAPQQFEVGQPGAYDLSKLTDDELATAEALARKALPSAEPHVEAVSEDKEPA